MQKDSNQKHGIPFGWHLPSQRMVKVAEVPNGRACKCTCVACGARLQSRQGAIRIWHFAHDEETNCLNAPEAAIHRMAKQMIAERSAVFMPPRQISRDIHGKNHVWAETITVDIQTSGLFLLADCVQEKTIGNGRNAGDSRRPDVYGLHDGRPLAIEIRNTHAVDEEKRVWLIQQGYSILEIAVADLALLTPDEISGALANRLFSNDSHSLWLTHSGDLDGELSLDQMEAEVRAARADEELTLLAKQDAEAAELQRRKETRERYRDIEDFRIRLGRSTIRIGRNTQRVSLKKFGSVPDAVFQGLKELARKHGASFNDRGGCWEFHRHTENEAFFGQFCAEVQQACLERYFGTPAVPTHLHPISPATINSIPEAPSFVSFADTAVQEAIDERAGILEFEAGFNRSYAEKLALSAMDSLRSADK